MVSLPGSGFDHDATMDVDKTLAKIVGVCGSSKEDEGKHISHT